MDQKINLLAISRNLLNTMLKFNQTMGYERESKQRHSEIKVNPFGTFKI